MPGHLVAGDVSRWEAAQMTALDARPMGEMNDAPDVLARAPGTVVINAYNGFNDAIEAIVSPGEKVNVYTRGSTFDQLFHVIGRTIDHTVGIVTGGPKDSSRLGQAWELAKDLTLGVGDAAVRDGFDAITPGPNEEKYIVRRIENSPMSAQYVPQYQSTTANEVHHALSV